MKKTIFLSAICALMTLASCQHKAGQPCSIRWDLSMLADNGLQFDSLCLLDESGNKLETLTKLDGNIAKLSGYTEGSQLGTVNIYVSYGGEQNSNSVQFVLEPGQIEMNTELGYFKGTPLNDSICQFITQVYTAFEKDEPIEPLVSAYIARHKDDVSAAIVMSDVEITSSVNPTLLSTLFESLPESTQKLPALQKIKEKISNKLTSVEGNKFIDFEATYNGQVQRLSDYVGKGKYVLVDFWASWCGPCRQEIPNLIAVYNKYAGDDFEVLGIATWDEPEATLQAIKEEKVAYPQIINAQEAGSKAYGIEGIPEIILFAPDGTILKRGLRGENIEKAVKEALGK